MAMLTFVFVITVILAHYLDAKGMFHTTLITIITNTNDVS